MCVLYAYTEHLTWPSCVLGGEKNTGHDPHGNGHGHMQVYACLNTSNAPSMIQTRQLTVLVCARWLDCSAQCNAVCSRLDLRLSVGGLVAQYTTKKWTRMIMASIVMV